MTSPRRPAARRRPAAAPTAVVVLAWAATLACAATPGTPRTPGTAGTAGATGAAEVAGGRPPVVGGSPSSACPDTPGQRVLDLLNETRRDAGLPALSVDLRLVAAARRHATDMARNGASGHTGTDGSQPADRVERAGYAWTFVAENTAAGLPTADGTVDGWNGSPAHRSNTLAPGARQAGVGYVEAAGSRYRHHWVVVFGATDGPPAQPADGCHP